MSVVTGSLFCLDCKPIAATTLDLDKLEDEAAIDIGFDIILKDAVEPTFAVFNDLSSQGQVPFQNV